MNIKVKVCGLTNLEDVFAALALDAWALGFIFAKQSRRYIQPSKAGVILNELEDAKALKVGVFAGNPVSEINAIADDLALDFVQLHGSYRESSLVQIQCPSLQAVHLHTQEDVESLDPKSCVHAFVVDTFDENHHGGTGRTNDWNLAEMAARNSRVILAGGLHAGNASKAVQVVKPYALDLCTGLEQSFGKKCHSKMRVFFALFDPLEKRTEERKNEYSI